MHRYKQFISLGIVFFGSMSFLDVAQADAILDAPPLDPFFWRKPEEIRPDLYPEQAEEGRSDDPIQGAISWSDSTGRYGWVWGYDDYYAAGNAAVQKCGSSDCERDVFTRFGALAQKSDNTWTFRSGQTQEEAAENALYGCQAWSTIPDSCEVVLVVGAEEGTIFQK